MIEIITIIGWPLTAILAYCVGERLHFTQRKKEKLEKFENAIDDYYLTAPSMKSNNDKELSKYDNFSVMYVTWSEHDKQKWLHEHNILEIHDFYEWLNEKTPNYGICDKFKQN